MDLLMQPKAIANPICQSLKILTQAKLIDRCAFEKQKSQFYACHLKIYSISEKILKTEKGYCSYTSAILGRKHTKAS